MWRNFLQEIPLQFRLGVDHSALRSSVLGSNDNILESRHSRQDLDREAEKPRPSILRTPSCLDATTFRPIVRGAPRAVAAVKTGLWLERSAIDVTVSGSAASQECSPKAIARQMQTDHSDVAMRNARPHKRALLPAFIKCHPVPFESSPDPPRNRPDLSFSCFIPPKHTWFGGPTS